MSASRVVWRALLALLLVFSQQQAVLHVLGHALDDQRQSLAASAQADGAPMAQAADIDALCAQCLAFAQLDHPATPQVAQPAGSSARFELPATAAITARDARFEPAYLSRAPPFLTLS
ncbi:hypothetical protein [Rhizobacter sp. SG703]|uniref:hypothetical protein n=1 Tax=Rhizobacter sp. SG703 TaxID=2587140 RepID=UPI0014487FC7|nr:hypothetical protein [Rhizobacter sp. SG703]NKI92795.1 hypothetical protein [Rhizobacter sp. SG703]